MKLYHFNSNTYGGEFSAIADSPEEALSILKAWFRQGGNGMDYDKLYFEDLYNEWRDATINKLPDQYTIEEYEKGMVLQTEVS